MRKSVTALVLTGVVVAGCGWKDSRVNPKNWFGSSADISHAVVDEGTTNPLMPNTRTTNGLFSRPEAEDTTVPIQSVTELRVEPAGSGAIVYARGIASRQGAFGAHLRAEPRVSKDGEETGSDTLVLTFRVDYPEYSTQIGSETTRTVNAAYNMSPDDLKEIRVVRVIGAQNSRETRRR